MGRKKGAAVKSSPPEVPSCPECSGTDWVVIYTLTLGVAITAERVDRVVVEDENLGPIQRVVCRECDFELSGEKARAHPAAQVAESAGDWPAWELGW